MEFYHPPRTGEPSIIVAFDLREPDGWRAAHDLRASWGRDRSIVHVLDTDHVVLELLTGVDTSGAKESA